MDIAALHPRSHGARSPRRACGQPSCRLNFSTDEVHEPGARRAASSTRVRPRAERRAHESSPATDLQRPAEHRSRAELSGAPPPVVINV